MRMCLICKKKLERTHFHHTSYEYNNLVEVCPKCHNKIHTKKLPKELIDLFFPIDYIVGNLVINKYQENQYSKIKKSRKIIVRDYSCRVIKSFKKIKCFKDTYGLELTEKELNVLKCESDNRVSVSYIEEKNKGIETPYQLLMKIKKYNKKTYILFPKNEAKICGWGEGTKLYVKLRKIKEK